MTTVPDAVPAPGAAPSGSGVPIFPAGPAATPEPEPESGPEPAGGDPATAGGDPATAEPILPEPVRQRVIALAAACLPGLSVEEQPAPLRRVARFAPNRRARLGGTLIAAQLAGDALFRSRLATRVLADAGELGTAILAGAAPGAADPVEVAALAYLGRPPGWLALIASAGEVVRADADHATRTVRHRDLEARLVRAEHDRAVARVEADKLRDELARLRDESGTLREENRTLTRALREAQAGQRRATELLATERGRLTRTAADHEAELRRLRGRLAEAQASAGANRAAAKEARQVDDARLWLLLETIGQSAAGLRRELALEPASVLPADAVAAQHADRPGTPAAAPARALEADDPARLDQLLALPRAHLIVDGYNVTKTGYADNSLEQQRGRLVGALGGLAAQCGAEVTVVFDGAERVVGLPPAPRGVRVLFSRQGQTADELIRRLVRAEPAGRPVVVISSDREVADGVRRHGAYPLGSGTLVRRLARV